MPIKGKWKKEKWMAWIEFIRELIHILSDKVTATIYFKMYSDQN